MAYSGTHLKSTGGTVAEEPDTLFIGCVDARMPINELMSREAASIKRTIANLVPEPGKPGSRDMSAVLADAIRNKDIRRIVVMGHTDCGGICACIDQPKDLPRVVAYMSPLNDRRDALESTGVDPHVLARRLEQDAVRLSLENLDKYPIVKEAGVKLEGWLLDVRGNKVYKGLEARKSGDYIPEIEEDRGPFPPHNPQTLFLGCTEARDRVHDILPAGTALIKRTPAAMSPHAEAAEDDRVNMEATLEFALKAKGIREIFVAGHEGCGICACAGRHADRPELGAYMQPLMDRLEAAGGTRSREEEAVRMTMDNLKQFGEVKAALADAKRPLHIKGWLCDRHGRRHVLKDNAPLTPTGAAAGIHEMRETYDRSR